MLILYNSTFYSTEEKKSTTKYKQKSRHIDLHCRCKQTDPRKKVGLLVDSEPVNLLKNPRIA